MRKTCSQCVATLPLAAFPTKGNRCKSCVRQYMLDRRRKLVQAGYQFVQEQRCTSCGETKDRSRFHKNADRVTGLEARCKDCSRRSTQAWYSSERAHEHYEKNKERLRAQRKARHIKRRYGLSPEDYVELLSAGCAVCGTTADLYVDHDHQCCDGPNACPSCIRGALCRRHNSGLGFFHDDPTELRLAADYVEKHRETRESNARDKGKPGPTR